MSKIEKQNNGMCHSEITKDEFILTKVKEMGIMEARAMIDKHFIILNNGDHAMLNKGGITMYDTKTVNSLYFNRLSTELKNYYHRDKTDIRTVICDIHKPFLTSTELNISEKMKHKYVPYNTFSKEVQEKVDVMINYMREILCSNREDILQHLLKMEAKMVRGDKNDACIYLKGPQGIGKSTHPEFLRMYVMGKGLSIESGSGPLKNKFNSELKGKVMTVFEELENFGSAEWMAISSTLKRWITSLTMQIEGKGKDVIDVINIMTFWLLSNNDAIQDDDGRRYFILPVSVKHMEDHKYFNDLRNKCFNDEVGHAYYCKLMEIDLKGFNSQQYPVTSAKLDSHVKRLDNVYKFVKDTFILHKCGIDKVSVNNLFLLYVAYCTDAKNKPKHKVDFNKALEEAGICHYKSNKENRYNISYEELQAIADKKHWIHELDDYTDSKPKTDNKEKYFAAEQAAALEQGVDKRDQSVKYVLQTEYEELESKYKELLESLKPKPKVIQVDEEEDEVPKKKIKKVKPSKSGDVEKFCNKGINAGDNIEQAFGKYL